MSRARGLRLVLTRICRRRFAWRWDLAPLSERDRYANNLAEVLDFSNANYRAPSYDVPPFSSELCPIL